MAEESVSVARAGVELKKKFLGVKLTLIRLKK